MLCRLFRDWVRQNYPNGEGDARTDGCILVDKRSLDSLNDQNAPGADEFDDIGRTWVWMVSPRHGERTTRVGISYLMPRTYLLLRSAYGWEKIYDRQDPGLVATP